MSGTLIGLLIGYVLFVEIRLYLQMRVNDEALATFKAIHETLESWRKSEGKTP